MDVCVILSTFYGVIVSGEFLKQLGPSERHVATPKIGLPHAPTCGFGAPVFGLACFKIDTENSLGMTLSKAKSGSAWQSHFWQCGTLRAAQNTKESKQPMCLRP